MTNALKKKKDAPALIVETKSTEVPAEEAPAATVENVDTNSILATLLAEVQQLRADRDEDKRKYEEEIAQAKIDATSAEAKAAEAAAADPYKPNALPENALDPRTDRPATIAEKLQVLEEMAKENGQDFDRARTLRALQGLPVEELNKFIFEGHAFQDEQSMELYKAKIEAEKIATIGKYLR